MFRKLGNTNMDIEQGDFMFYIADIFTMGVQYGTRTQMCELIESVEWADDPFSALGAYAIQKGVSADEYDAMALRNTTVDINKNIRQWTYQYCTEFAWFQIPNDQYPMRSESLKTEFWVDYCQRIFSKDIKLPAVKETNEHFGGLDIKGENIFFLTAGEDPW